LTEDRAKRRQRVMRVLIGGERGSQGAENYVVWEAAKASTAPGGEERGSWYVEKAKWTQRLLCFCGASGWALAETCFKRWQMP